MVAREKKSAAAGTRGRRENPQGVAREKEINGTRSHRMGITDMRPGGGGGGGIWVIEREPRRASRHTA